MAFNEGIPPSKGHVAFSEKFEATTEEAVGAKSDHMLGKRNDGIIVTFVVIDQ
jgi:hypothetical protein